MTGRELRDKRSPPSDRWGGSSGSTHLDDGPGGRTWLWVLVTIVVLASILLAVPLDRVGEALGWIGVGPTLLAVVISVVDVLLVDSDRLRRFCRYRGLDVTLRDAAAMVVPAVALGLVAPLHSDKVLKARLLNVRHHRPFGEALGIVVTDRGVSLISHAALVVGGLFGLWLGAGWTISALAVTSGTALSGAIFLIVLKAFTSWRPIARHRLLGPVAAPFWTMRPSFIAAMFGYALVADLAVASTLQVMAASARLDVPFAAILAFRHGSLLIDKVPITVGGYGLREGSLALGLSLYGDAPVAVAVALWFGVCSSLVPSLVALMFRPFVSSSLERLRRDLAMGLRQVSALRGARRDPRRERPGSGEVNHEC